MILKSFFVDVNETITDALNERGSYEIELAEDAATRMPINHVRSNNVKQPQAVIEAIKHANIVTTAIVLFNILLYRELIAKGIQARQAAKIMAPLTLSPVKNMIGGSEFLKTKVDTFLTEENKAYAETYCFQMLLLDLSYPVKPMLIHCSLSWNLLANGL